MTDVGNIACLVGGETCPTRFDTWWRTFLLETPGYFLDMWLLGDALYYISICIYIYSILFYWANHFLYDYTDKLQFSHPCSPPVPFKTEWHTRQQHQHKFAFVPIYFITVTVHSFMDFAGLFLHTQYRD